MQPFTLVQFSIKNLSKLSFLDLLKSNMGEEMTEMMSQEITRVMDQQSKLEKEYARLVTLRSELKGLSNKHKLEDVRNDILRVAKDLKESTRTLCRQLQDNPDVEGNQRKIKQDKQHLVYFLENLINEMRDLSYSQFKAEIKAGLDEQGEFERLRKQEKELNQEIKKLNEDFKKAQDDYAKEALENNQEILNLKKQVNETKTEAELYVQYRDRETDGKQACQQRQYDKVQNELEERIKMLEKQIKTEKLVSERIRGYVDKKTQNLNTLAEDQEKIKDKKIESLEKEKDEINRKKEEDEKEISRMHQLIQQEVDEKNKRDKEEQERQEDLERRKKEKMEMEDAARYIQRKWKWFQDEGRFLAKKKKKEPIKFGNPWTVLPIKNAKQARDLIEVHLSDRDIDMLEKFEDFPNLETVWLNNNKVMYIFINEYQLMPFSNMKHNIDGTRKFKFLETLLLSNNRLRNLDKFITFLSKFAFLDQLDLFGNPLSEEPDYRLKIIYAMPQIKILDRHPITTEERIKASKLDPEYERKQAKFVQPTKIKPIPVSQAFSKGEKDLYKEVDQIKMRTLRIEQDEEHKRQQFYEKKTYVGIPVPTKKQENKDKFGQNTEDKLDEWEKNQVKKLFREYDKDKNGLQKDELKKLMRRLSQDDCIIGKVPALNDDQIERLFDEWNTNKDNKVSWIELREGLNKWKWTLSDRERLNDLVDSFFKQSQKFKMQGNDKDSKEYAARALRLQGSLTKTKPIEIEKKREEVVPKRGDFFHLKVFRKDPTNSFMDKSSTFKFNQ
ncbi:leucine rich repeat family protein [Stylonychia lemnae]|uniref:Leucine rich repeat family protein n=1 Tax=Stylonychia lemnae TaxID=5949 RepID=A0A078AKP9_STYLE|nr:leucine rich repeat family protein [Stylonychia lemnae]|eukprot:CDW81373.1 leucine rich repeat family protein [Stylonychia lemnae]